MSLNYLEQIELYFASRETSISRDMKVNLKKLLGEGALSPTEALYATLSVAQSAHFSPLIEIAKAGLTDAGIAAEHIQEAVEAAAIMGMLNTYYKFKTMIQNEVDYANAGLRMQSLAKPQLGKAQFEMLAFAVSVLNGCETCIRSHEKVLRAHDVSAEKIHDLARIAAVVKGISALP